MPYIKVNPSALISMGETLQNSSSKVGQIESDFSSDAGKLDWDVRSASDIQRRMDRINSELEEYARILRNMQTFIGTAKSKYASIKEAYSDGGGKSGGAGSTHSFGAKLMDGSKATPKIDVAGRIKQSFDLKSLGEKVVGSFGPVGATASFALSLTEGNLEKGLKGYAKQLITWTQFTNKYPWENFALVNRFGHDWGTKNYIKNLTGLARQSSSAAASWFSRFKRNFSSKISGTFVKFDSKTGAYKANKLGIAGVVIDLAASGYGNYKQVKAGEITADRAVVETVAEVGAGLLLSTAAGALAAALLPATAPVAAVAIASAGIVWAADGLTKLFTGGEKGLSEVVSEGVGWVYDKYKEMHSITAQHIASGFEEIKSGIGEVSSNACKWVFGTS